MSKDQIRHSIAQAARVLVCSANHGDENDRALADAIVAAVGAWHKGEAERFRDGCKDSLNGEKRISLARLEPSVN